MISPLTARLWPCQRAEVMVQQAPWQASLKQFRSLISAPPDTYAELHLTTLYRFMELCQALPVALLANSAAPLEPYSLVKRAFALAVAVLQIRRGLMLPSHSDSEQIAAQEARWTYALLTAALFHAIPANWQTAYRVGLYKNEQERLGIWHPLTGSLAEPKTFYRLEAVKAEQNLLPLVVDASLLRTAWIGRLIPAPALRWLADSPVLFSDWWEALSQSALLPDNNHLVKEIHEIAEKLGIVLTQPTVIQSAPASMPPPPVTVAITAIEPKSPAAPSASRQALIRLNQWLEARLPHPEDRPFLRVEKGLFIDESALQRMISQYPHYASREALIHLLTEFLVPENGRFTVRYRSLNVESREIRPGVILAQAHLKEAIKSLPLCQTFFLDYSSTVT